MHPIGEKDVEPLKSVQLVLLPTQTTNSHELAGDRAAGCGDGENIPAVRCGDVAVGNLIGRGVISGRTLPTSGEQEKSRK